MNNISVLPNAEAFASVVLDRLKGTENPLICLSGGSTIPPVMKALGSESNKLNLPDSLRWTWNDERLVPYTDSGSNFGAVKNFIPKGELYPLPCDESDESLKTYCASLNSVQEAPAIDLLILGFGDDGHIASLFPGTSALESEQVFPWVVRNTASYAPTERWSWTMPSLQKAKRTLVLYKGGETGAKAEHLQSAMKDTQCDTPLARFIRGAVGEVEFYRVEG